MRPKNAANLAMRDPALAAIVGAVDGSDFGRETDFGAEFGAQFAGSDYGAEFGDDYGLDAVGVVGTSSAPLAAMGRGRQMAPANAPAAAGGPSIQQLHGLWNSHAQKQAYSQQRNRLLEPNLGSDIKIERYGFAINQTITLAAAIAINMTGNPDTTIRPQRVTINAPAPGFMSVTELKVSNVSVTVGGVLDAFDFSALGVGQTLDMPTLTPANRATLLGNYSGFVPPGYVGGNPFLIAASFKGPSQIVA